MDEILKTLQQFEGRMYERFVHVDQRFEQFDERLYKIDQKLGQFDDRLFKSTENNVTMIGKLDQMESTLNTLANTFIEGTVAILNRIDKNTIFLSRDTEFLSRQIGKHEMYLHRINEK